MAIDINIGQGGRLGSPSLTQLEGSGAAKPAAANKATTPTTLTITEQPRGLPVAEPSAAGIPDSALSRKDDIGRLVDSVFNLPPPPMPSFVD